MKRMESAKEQHRQMANNISLELHEPQTWLAQGFIVVLVCLAGWSLVARVDITVSATGRLLPLENTKSVQSTISGTISSVRVVDGQHVSVGEALLQLDSTEVEARHRASRRRMELAELVSARDNILESVEQRQPRSLPNFPKDMSGFEMSKVETSRMVNEFAQREDQVLVGEAMLEAKQVALRKAETDFQTDITQLATLKEELNIRNLSLKLGVGSRVEFLSSKLSYETTYKSMLTARIDLLSASNELRQVGLNIKKQKQDYLVQLDNERSSAETELISAKQDYAITNHSIDQSTIRAPVKGFIQQLLATTKGGYLGSGNLIMNIVPEDSSLIAEAVIPSNDIGFIHVGEVVDIKIGAFEYGHYGTIGGVVTSISRDAALPDHRDPLAPNTTASTMSTSSTVKNEDPGYRIRLQLKQSYIMTRDGSVPLRPGMEVIANVRTGSRTIFSYFGSGLREMTIDSFHER